MLVYVIHKQGLYSKTLPSKIYGSYQISDFDENNKERMLINISAQEGRWVAFSNKNVKIVKNQEVVRSAFLEAYQFLLLQIKGQEGFIVLYACPVNDGTWMELAIPHDLEFTIGQENENAIVCKHPLIAPHHAKLIYQKNTWILQDLNSQYKTFVNHKVITGQQVLFHGDIIFIMGLKLIVRENKILLNNPLGSVSYDRTIFKAVPQREKIPPVSNTEEMGEISLYDEQEYFIRSPRFTEKIEEKSFRIESHPTIEEQDETPLLYTIGPMITMGSTSFVMLLVAFMSYQNNDGDITSILPTVAISASMLAGTLIWPTLNRRFQKKQQQKRHAKIEKRYGEYLIQKEKELKEISNSQKQILLSNYLNAMECYNLIINHSRNLWMRELPQNDFLSLRLGIGKVPLKIHLQYPEEKFQLDQDVLDEKMRLIIEQNRMIDGAPIVESLTEKNMIAITGVYEHVKAYMDNLLLQMMALHSYYDLKIVLLTNQSRANGWSYLKQLPHLFKNDKTMRFFATDFEEGKEVTQYLQQVFKQRLEASSKTNLEKNCKYKNFSSYYVIITDDYKMAKEYSFIEELLKEEANLGFSFVILHSTLANLPTECKAFIGINDYQQGGIFESEITKDTQRSFMIEPLNKVNLLLASLHLANIPIENKEEDYRLPKTLGFLEMYDVGKIEQLNSLERWKRNMPILSLAAPIGLAMNGSLFKLDLHEKEQGPHGLIAGMTGSGKSEFIITYILSMAIQFHPDEVQFVLIDYKGGGLVGAFENKETGVRLPHLAGTITNLDTAEIHRALSSIESELKRRQHLFNEARELLNEGTIDIYKYQRYYRDGLLKTPVSHLFIISDEFAELKSQQPEFMDQLISTARIGRSLGVHLILATQKPSGVVNDQIWSNSRFRVCLKVQEAGDSNEVIKRPDAASLTDVGRFYLQVGYNEFFAMGQAAYAGVPYIPQDKVYHEVDDRISFINSIGKSIQTISPPRPVSLQSEGEELPKIVSYLSLLAEEENIVVKPLWLPKLPDILYVDAIKKAYQFQKKPYEIEIVLGVYDNPKAQKQGLLTIDMKKGNVVVYSMNEKNTVENTILYSLITTYHTDELNLYVFDFDSETLKMYQDAPQVGDVIFAHEKEKVEKTFKMLLEEIERRKKLFQNYNGSYEFYCKHSSKTLPSIVFLIAGYENFKETYEEMDMTLSKVCRDGVKYGVYTIVTAISDRSLRLSMRTNFPQIVPLKLSAAIEYNMLLGVKAPVISDVENRGVILVLDEAYEFQTASVCEKEKLYTFVREVCQTLNSQIASKAPQVPVLPEHVSWEDIARNGFSLSAFPIGLYEESIEIATFDFTKSLITLLNAVDIDALVAFSKTLIEKCFQEKTFSTVVYDGRGIYQDATFETSKTVTDLKKKIEEAELKEVLVFITGISSLSTGFQEIGGTIDSYLKEVQAKGNCHFVLVERLDDLKPVQYESWFKTYIALDEGLFIGRGLNTSTIHQLITPFRMLSFPLPPNYGYCMKKGIAERIKVVEGVIQNGE